MAKENYPDGRDQIEKLKKLLMLTTSEHDAEALAAIRAANKIMATLNLTWDRCIGIPLERMDPLSQSAWAQSVATQSGNGFGMDSHAKEAFQTFFGATPDLFRQPTAEEIKSDLEYFMSRKKAHGKG